MNWVLQLLVACCSGMFIVFCGVAWKVIARLNRDDSLKKDYPPHRHINGKIIYPQEYQPGAIERLGPV